MRSIRLIWIGKSQELFVQDGIKVYLKKLSHYIKVDFEEIKPVKYNSGTTDQWR
ncbi:23S rRNA (pseudouridine(1915)-N(3))-methyltransferase RlmH, partial [bacterium]|nr:23S rRNA (pseudouridine(1915)-N(3))-methyltransferase RlmH [bacterium]